VAESLEISGRKLSGSTFARSNLSGAIFEDVDLSGATFRNINLRGARFSAIDFGGARFSCVNTGEGMPREAVVFSDVELHGCRFQGGSFVDVEIVGAAIDGMKIGGILVSEMMEAYKAMHGA
jgi:uncharacterized protein YjbI with pentapeptide repeats